MRLHPADRATLFILAVVTATLAASLAAGRPVAGALALHAGLLAGFAAAAWWLARRPRPLLHGMTVLGVMFALYTTLGHVAFEAIPWIADPWLAAADRALLLGRSPALLLDRGWTHTEVEVLAFCYAVFIPYLYLCIFLGLVGRPPGERGEFVTGFAVLYALSFLGYLFLPARGPIVEMATLFSGPLPGGTFHRLVVRSIDDLGGPHGAFPSLHLGASFYAMWFDLRHGTPLRGLIYLPLVAMIAAATLVLRYHYAVDLVAGVLLALVASAVAARAVRRHAEDA
ncbi:MAG TPA: phosphatase PAP2 family protein [Longimicrobiaceae bacterium]|nr:phosphatase PAP2 family protein [Longimicrobiaceae bacterium]